MRYTQYLSYHLTPEWRKHYIQYEDLKKKLYRMISDPQPTQELEEDCTDRVQKYVVDTELQDEFFNDMQQQLDDIESFYRAREAELSHSLRELNEEVQVYEALLVNKLTRELRATKRKRRNLKQLVSEFYLEIAHLQHFQQLNREGFRKILKKQDKLANNTTRGKTFLKEIVLKNYFLASKQIPKMIEKTENLMIDKLEAGNRTKAMNQLRHPPLDAKDVRSHWATLRAGWLMGFIFLSIIILVLGIIFRPLDSWGPVTPIVRGLRVGFVLSVWFYGFAINTYVWRKWGVNSMLIFEFNPRHYLNFVQLFEVASLIAVIFLIGLYLTIFSPWLGNMDWLGPLVMLLLISVVFVLPAPFIYLKSRLWFAKELGRICLSPLYDVTFPDFWIADQMNSLVVIVLDIEYFFCYLVYGLNAPDDSSIQCGSVKYGVRVVLGMLPAWFRFIQCIRRYNDTKKVFPHLVNAGKYSTTFVVVIFGSIASGVRVSGADVQPAVYYVFLVLWIISGITSTAYTFTWDVKMDWGLFEGGYKLRSELIYPHWILYVLAVIENLIFRSLWTLNISVGASGSKLLDGNILGTFLAVGEVFRRFVWNFFRLENEHLNNVGEFRIVRDISIRPIHLDMLPIGDEEEPDLLMLKRGLRGKLPADKTKYSLRQRRNSKVSNPYTLKMPVLHEEPLDLNCASHLNGQPLSHQTDSTLPILELHEQGECTHVDGAQETASTCGSEITLISRETFV